jgi:hypothetical protein
LNKELTGNLYLSFITLETFSFQNGMSIPCEYSFRSGGYRDDVTPVPIPNTEVKLIFGDDTWIIKSWESSTPPVLSKKTSKDVFFVLSMLNYMYKLEGK